MTLKELKIGQAATVLSVGGEGALRQHFLDMGLVPGTEVCLIKYAPMGDPMQVQIHGYELTLRLDDAAKIEVTDVQNAADRSLTNAAGKAEKKYAGRHEHTEHPGLGETGKYHVKADEHPLPDGTKLTFALAGNQNSGKTTLFNQLTGANQHVGNFPGVTVDRKSGPIRGLENSEVIDLPGIYSLSPYTNEEIVTRQFILDEKPTGIINIVDATNIERNLYLTMQLMELNTPMVLALNMMDELVGNEGTIYINEMESLLGIPVVPIAAIKNEGVDELIRHASHVAQFQERPGRMDFCDESDHGGAVHRCLHAIMHLIEDHAQKAGIPLRFAATKLAEGDGLVMDALALSQNEKELIEHIACQMEEERGLDRAAAIADMRFTFIKKLVAETVVKPKTSKEHVRSQKMDQILTGRILSIPLFIAIMAAIFVVTFNYIGAWLQGLLEIAIGALTNVVDAGLTAVHANDAIHSLIIDGIFSGVGSVLSFVPVIVVLFFFMSLLEDTGYMARVAFIMDKILRRIGLSGRSIVPMLLGFGCSVPSIMACRTLPSDRDRRMTIMLTPFMSCSAKIPIYAFLTAAFFPRRGGFIMVGLYVLGIVVAIVISLIFKNTMFKGEPVPFVMELPNYRMPGAKSVLRLMWNKAWDFIRRAFTVIFVATIVIWFLQTFDPHLAMATNSQDSILAIVAGWIAPVLKPLGLGDWRVSTALISGFLAKESVVSTIGVLFGSTQGLLAAITPLAAGSLLVFCLLYTPCVAAVAAAKKELGAKWALYIVVMQCVVAWVCAFLLRLIGLIFGFA